MRTQTRREFFKSAGAACVGASQLSEGLADSKSRGRQGQPNLLIIMADQLTASVLGCYGGPVPTPHINRLANEGVVFEQATCPTPYCSPSRASLVTGMYPHAHGIVLNCRKPGPGVKGGQHGLTPDDVTMEKILSADGYATHHYGKWHLHGERLPYYPDQYDLAQYQQEMAEAFARVRQGDRSGYMQFYSLPLPVEVSPAMRKAAQALGERWQDEQFADFILKMGRLTLPLEQHFDVRFADRTVARVEAWAGKKPFMVTCSFVAPHDPNVAPSPYYEMFDPEKVGLPDNWQVREPRFEKQWSRRIVADLGEPGLREFLRVYYAMVKMIDDQVGRLLRVLDARRQTDNTLIVFTTDHGDMCGGHGMVWKSTDAFYEEVVRIPYIIRYPRRLKPQRTQVPACLTNLMATLFDLLDKPIPDHVQGHSLVPYMTGQRDPSEAPAFTFSERVPGHPEGLRKVEPGTKGSFMIRGKGWKYIRYRQGDEYLYDLINDPGETKNLAGDGRCAARQEELSDALDAWLRRTGFPGKV